MLDRPLTGVPSTYDPIRAISASQPCQLLCAGSPCIRTSSKHAAHARISRAGRNFLADTHSEVKAGGHRIPCSLCPSWHSADMLAYFKIEKAVI